MPRWILMGLLVCVLISTLSAAPAMTRSPARLQALLAEYDRHLAVAPDQREHLADLREQIDREAGQKDAAFSRLFWHTDIDAALAQARRENKPVLSFRLLGRLDEDMSCANSRFFRAAAYSNEAVSAFLRESYVLHWASVRDVPMMTIDYADGRQIKRPLTGNSVHLVLWPDGRVIDALPGLYSAEAFAQVLKEDVGLIRSGNSAQVAQRLAGVAQRTAAMNLAALVASAPVRANERTASKAYVERRPLAVAGFA